MSNDGEDPAAGGGPLSGSADDGAPVAAAYKFPAADAQGSIDADGTTTTADAVGPGGGGGGGGGGGMPPIHPGRVPQAVPSPGRSYMPPGQSLMTAVEWSPIVHDRKGKGKDTVVEEDSSKVAPLPPNFSPGEVTAQQNSAIGAASEGSTGLDIDQVLGLVDDLPDPASMPEPTPVGNLMSDAESAASVSASVSKRGAVSSATAASNASSGVSYPTTAGLAQTSKTSGTSASAVATTAATATSVAGESGGRRQRRLERNRESARASRRRRKVYLEELEEKVVCLSEEMDQGRRDHVQRALGTVMQLRKDRLKEVERDLDLDLASLQIGNRSSNSSMGVNPALEHHVQALGTYLSRTSDELRLAEIFRKQQLLSLSLPQHRKFVLWLTIQNDVFYRGGRAASERLSAARIGERMLQNGIDRAPPSGDMWPLFCNDVGLSYDQEEKIRTHQRALLMESGPWLHRHTAAAADATIEGATRAVNAAAEMTQGRERSALDVLTIEQWAKFQAWAASRKDRIERLARPKARAASSPNKPVQQAGVDLQTSPDRCDAANLYIINDRLYRVCSKMPPAPSLIKPTNLKKLSRRASFESLGSSMANLEGGGKKMEKSFPSTGSLKRSAASMSDDSLASKAQKEGPAPESAEAASAHLVASALKDVRGIIPKAPPREFINISPPHPALGKPPSQRQSYARQQQQPQQRKQDFLHQGGYARTTPPAYNPGSPISDIGLPLSPLHEPTPDPMTSGGGGGVDTDMVLPDGQPVPLPIPVEWAPGSFVESSHGRVPSFLPQHMNILPEEGFLNGVAGDAPDPTTDMDMLFDLNDEDWALGLDMEEN